ADGWSLASLRFRTLRYWFAGIGLLSLTLLYVNPLVISAIRAPAITDSLPEVVVPLVPFPTLAVPKVQRPAPLATTPATPTHAASRTHTVRISGAPFAGRYGRDSLAAEAGRRTHRVPVVTDRHSLTPPQQKAKKKVKDPFANATVVQDAVGAPPVLPNGTDEPQAPTMDDSAAA